jgi:hypothetical protein
MKWLDVIILEIHLDERLPVAGVLLDFGAVVDVA